MKGHRETAVVKQDVGANIKTAWIIKAINMSRMRKLQNTR